MFNELIWSVKIGLGIWVSLALLVLVALRVPNAGDWFDYWDTRMDQWG